jgi:hypothetical protein
MKRKYDTRATQKVTSSELLTKQSMRKKVIYKKYDILRLLLNIVTAGIETFDVLGNTFFVCLYEKSLPPVSSATFLHLPSTHHY